MADFLSAAGPLFGPDFVLVTVNDDTGMQYSLEVYPDASNDELQKAGLPRQYYWQPSRVYLAKKQDSPEEFAFGMTVFKGLMTTETNVGITDAQTSSGDVEAGGGFCSFTTTFAVPDSVIANAIKVLKAADHPAPIPRLQPYFVAFGADEPDPLLGVVPIVENDVTIEVPELVAASAGSKAPMFISAQGAGKGSIEAHGFTSFLVTCNELAAGAIAGSFENGVSPFTIHCNLKEQVYIHACQIKVTVDADKVYDAVSAAVSTGGFLGITNASLEASYSNALTTGGIVTDIQMDDADLTPDLKQWIQKNVDDLRKTAFDMLKSEIFDWKPEDQPAAASDKGLVGSVFGGTSVSLKATYQKRSVKFDQTIKLDSSIAVSNTVSGTLDDLLPAVKEHLDTYLAIVDIGEYFKKIQIAATSAIDFSDKLSDGTDLSDPIRSVQLEVSYPDFDNPAEADNTPNLVTQAQGFHYTIGKKDPNAAGQLAVWTKDNADDIVNIAFLRLDKDLPNWPADQVHLRKTVVFDGDDPRVELSDGGSTYVVEQTGSIHAPKLTADEVGYVFVRFMLDRALPKDNVTVTLTCSIGARTDTITITKENQRNVLWEIFSDKYVGEESFSYSAQVEVVGGFTDEPVTWQSAGAVTVALPTGRVKYINPLKLPLPSPPADQIATINKYIAGAQG